jgi:hypothetical protein
MSLRHRCCAWLGVGDRAAGGTPEWHELSNAVAFESSYRRHERSHERSARDGAGGARGTPPEPAPSPALAETAPEAFTKRFSWATRACYAAGSSLMLPYHMLQKRLVFWGRGKCHQRGEPPWRHLALRYQAALDA